MDCPKCLKNLIWGGDHSYEDYDLEGEGIVSNHTCQNEECPITDVLIYESI